MKDDYPITNSVLSLLKSKLEQFGSKTALCIKNGDNWQNLSYAELGQRACNLANYLIESGIQPGDRIAILSESRPEWSIGLFAGFLAGAIVVPLDIKLSETELNSILSDCVPQILLTSLSHQNIADKLKSSVVSIAQVLTLEKVAIDLPSESIQSQDILQFQERQLDEVASIIYTSGTTGKPKGVAIAFRNLIFEAETLGKLVGIGPNDSFLSILPLNHLLELSGGLLSVLYAGGTVCYAQSLYPQDILQMMQERQITAILGVPLFFKTLYNSIQKEVVRGTPLKRLWFQGAMTLAKKLPWQTARRIIFFPIHQKFGGKFRLFISGGAALDMDVAGFFEQIGLPIIQGYGLTETGPVICVNSPKANRIGSVGKPLPGVEIKIDSPEPEQTQGEVLTRGPHVMKGYYKSEELTRQVLDRDGWFHTGDLGVIDADGFLHITGRIKNLIVLGGSKKVNPEEVEAILSKSPAIQEICVLGRLAKYGIKKDTEEVCAVVVPSDFIKQELQTKPEALLREIEREIANLATNLASYKRPSRIFMHLEALPKTSTRKIKRPLVLEWINTLE
ncbi:MAG: AMP-binding protein [Nostoc sp. ChiSLP02]|nr:AMP-binding protein [Nostoc sp. DedSLP05]MDZ8103252.1 AMP-binding protein [Nostoc sp. DedSLP01]MDZ8187699.1 AMP-binding protein [Nostoc sp. ChiSLP02]